MTDTKSVPKAQEVKFGDYSATIIEDFYGKIDPFYLSIKDPNFEYRFIRDDSMSGGKNITMKTGNLLLQKGGWKVCGREHLMKLGIKDGAISRDPAKDLRLSPDGLYRAGDQILVYMPKELYAKKEAHKKKLADEKIGDIQTMIKEGSSELSGTGHPDMKGLQPKEKLRGNWK
jgi:hypothetical protein